MEQHHIGNKFLMKYLKLNPISYVCLKIVHCYEMCLFGNDKAFGILIELLHYAKRRTRRLCLQRVCGRNRLNNEPAHDVKFLVLASPECPLARPGQCCGLSSSSAVRQPRPSWAPAL